MTEPLLCLVAFSFLCWVLVLESRLRLLEKENRELKQRLVNMAAELKKGVEVSGARRIAHPDGSPASGGKG